MFCVLNCNNKIKVNLFPQLHEISTYDTWTIKYRSMSMWSVCVNVFD